MAGYGATLLRLIGLQSLKGSGRFGSQVVPTITAPKYCSYDPNSSLERSLPSWLATPPATSIDYPLQLQVFSATQYGDIPESGTRLAQRMAQKPSKIAVVGRLMEGHFHCEESLRYRVPPT